MLRGVLNHHCFQAHRPRAHSSHYLGDVVDRLYAVSIVIRKSTPCHDTPAWETERPASSINWSIEKAPVLISSLSSAAAFSAVRVFAKTLGSISRARQQELHAFKAILIIEQNLYRDRGRLLTRLMLKKFITEKARGGRSTHHSERRNNGSMYQVLLHRNQWTVIKTCG